MKLYVVVLSLAVTGCMISEATEEDVELAETEQYLKPSCDEPGCGLNSPEIANYNFYDLNLDGQPNAQGFAITRFEKNDVDFKLSVSHGRIRGTRTFGTYLQWISGSNLVGANIHVTHPSGKFIITIKHVQPWGYWAESGSSANAQVEGYELLYRRVGGHYQNVCSDPPVRGPDTLWADSLLTFVFEGERIDQATKTIEPVLDTRWFNLGCSGSTLAKLHLTGHTHAAKLATSGALTTTIPERQTMLKMLSADYCGTGEAFTIQGTPLDWADHKNWMEYVYPRQFVEARWNQDGAVCLNMPRVYVNPVGSDGTMWKPSVINDVKAACAAVGRVLQPCPHQTTEPGTFHLTSANPY